VLIVDDDPVQLRLSAMQLELAGFKVSCCSNARTAIEMAHADRPDVIMSDVLMDDADGFALCRMVRLDEGLKTTPVVLVSAHFHDRDDRELALQVGAQALVGRTTDHSSEIEALRASVGSQPLAVEAVAEMPPLYSVRMARQLSRMLKKSQSAEARYRALIDHANDAIAVLGDNGEMLEVNRRMTEMLGLPAAQLIGRSLHDFVVPEARDGAVDEACAHPIRRADGTIVYISFSAAPVELEGRTTILSIGRDETVRVEHVRALRRTDQTYRSLVENLPDAVWTARPDGTLLFLSSNISKIIGLSAQEVTAESVEARFERIVPEDREHVRAGFKALLTHDTLFDVEYRMERPTGELVWVRNRATTSRVDGRVDQIVGVLSDISARRRLEDQLRQAQKMEAVGQLTGGIAHDFNNMLAVVLANCHFLVDDLPEADLRRADALEILRSAERAAALTKQLLALSRRQVLEPTTLNLNTVIDSLKAMLGRLIGEDISLTITSTPGLGSIRADAGQVEQVIMNLVVNARDAMPMGGTVSIATSNGSIEAATAEASQLQLPAGRYVLITVSDSGSGMDEATQRHMFEPFFTTKEKGKGTGLGLSTSYGIIRQSGGAIRVASEVGRGSVFTVYLPRVDADDQPKARRPAEAKTFAGAESILVIEDDAPVRNAVQRMLSSYGYQVMVAENAEQAVQLAKNASKPISLVLSDVIMPGPSGPHAVEAIQTDNPLIKVLYMSGHTDHAALRDVTLSGQAEFIQKPFSPQMLAKRVRATLDVKRPASASSAVS
jgi:PAS domain S-box-containing protein